MILFHYAATLYVYAIMTDTEAVVHLVLFAIVEIIVIAFVSSQLESASIVLCLVLKILSE